MFVRRPVLCGHYPRWLSSAASSITRRPKPEARILELTSPTAVINLYASLRPATHAGAASPKRSAKIVSSRKPQPLENPASVASSLVLVSLALCRVSANLRQATTADLVATRSGGLQAMLDDLHDLSATALFSPTMYSARVAASEPRFLAATLHCLARLHEQLAVRHDAVFILLLRHALRPGGCLESPTLTPHIIAQLAWAIAIYPREVVLQAKSSGLEATTGSTLTTSDVKSSDNSGDGVPNQKFLSRNELRPVEFHSGDNWIWIRIAAALERIAISPHNVNPLDLSMLAAAAARSAALCSGGVIARTFGAMAELALHQRGYASTFRNSRPLSSFSGAVLVALPSTLAAAYSAWSRPRAIEQKAPEQPKVISGSGDVPLGAAIHAAVASTMFTIPASPSAGQTTHMSDRTNDRSPVSHPAVTRLLIAIAEESAVRLAAAESNLEEGGAVVSRSRRLLSHGTSDTCGPDDHNDTSLPDLFSSVHRDAGSHGSDSDNGADRSGGSPTPLPVTLLAPLLRAYATLGFSSPVLFGAAAHFLGLVSASSGSDTGGAAGFRALGSHPEDSLLATSGGISQLHPLHERTDGDVAVASTSPFKGLVVIAAAFAKVRYADEDDTPRMWAALLASTTTRVRREIECPAQKINLAPEKWPHKRQRGDPMDPLDVARLLHACTDASIPAAPLARAALVHLRLCVQAYSVSAMSRLLWAAAMQGVYDAQASSVAFNEVLRRVEAATSSAIVPPDDFPMSLLAVPEGSGARIPSVVRAAQSQLYMAWLGLSLEGDTVTLSRPTTPACDATAAAQALTAVPVGILSAWRTAYSRAEATSHNHRSLLHAEVSRLLSLAGIEHKCEVLLPEGLCVDVIIPVACTEPPVVMRGASRPSAAATAVRNRKQCIVFEINGPSHYAPLVQGAPGTDDLSLQRSSSSGTFLPSDTKLPPYELSSLRSISRLPGDDEIESTTGVKVPVPSLRTRTRSRWLSAAGYETVTIDWAEWSHYPSTEERLELLAEKGLRIPRHLRSF